MTPDLMEAGARTRAEHDAKAKPVRRFIADEPYFGQGVALYVEAVSYTHLTLPTNREV